MHDNRRRGTSAGLAGNELARAAGRRVHPLRCVLLLSLCIGAAGSAWAKPHHDHRDPYARAAAAYAAVLDGEVLWGRNLDAQRAPASLTKLLTALVLLDSSWQPDEILTVSHAAAHTIPSKAGLHTGDRISAEEALIAMLVHSANDACMTLVEHAAVSLPVFAARLNARAEQLGMRESHFVHPCGFDEPGQYSTVNDLLRLAQAAHANPTIAGIVSREEATIAVESPRRTRHLTFHSTNHLLGHLEGVSGLKTGYTAQAGRCLIAVADQSGHRVWIVLLDSRRRWWVASRLFNAAFAAAARRSDTTVAGVLSRNGT